MKEILITVWFLLTTILCFVYVDHSADYSKKIDDLQRTIVLYDNSDKVIKDTTIYGNLPIVLRGAKNITFVDVTITGLIPTGKESALMEIVGWEEGK